MINCRSLQASTDVVERKILSKDVDGNTGGSGEDGRASHGGSASSDGRGSDGDTGRS